MGVGKSATLGLNEKLSLIYGYGVWSCCSNVRFFWGGGVKHMCWPGEWKWGGCSKGFFTKSVFDFGHVAVAWEAWSEPWQQPPRCRKKALIPLLWQRDMKQYLTKALQANMMANQQLYRLQRGAHLPSKCLFSSSSNFTNNISWRCLGQYF